MLKKVFVFLILSSLVVPLCAQEEKEGPKMPKFYGTSDSTEKPQYSYLYNTALIKAITDNDSQRVNFLLYAGMDPNEPNDEGLTPLVAAAKSDAEITEMLLNHKAKVDEPSINGTTPLMAAAAYGQPANVRLLLEYGANPNLKDNQGKTAMDYASENKNHKAALELINTPVIKLDDQETALAASLIAAVGAKDRATMQTMLKRGADINSQNRLGQTPIIAAVNTNDIKFVKEILTYHPNLEIQDNAGRSPLMHAIQNDNEAIAKLLMVQGANPQTQDLVGTTPLILAAKNGNTVLVKEILASGADVNTQDKLGRSALSWAVENKDNETFYAVMSKNNLRPDLPYSQENVTPLTVATMLQERDMANDLIQKGADVNFQDSSDNTPLVYAVENNDTDIASLLLSYGANPLLKDANEPDLHDTALRNKNTKLAALLETAANNPENIAAAKTAKANKKTASYSYAMPTDEKRFWDSIENIDEYIASLELQTAKAKAVKAEREAQKNKLAVEKQLNQEQKPKATKVQGNKQSKKTTVKKPVNSKHETKTVKVPGMEKNQTVEYEYL